MDNVLAEEKARLLNLPVINLYERRPIYESLMLVPENIALKNRIVVFETRREFAEVAVDDPFAKNIFDLLEEVRKKSGKPVQVYVSSPESIDYGLAWYKDVDLDKRSLQEIHKEEKAESAKAEKKFPKVPKDISFSSINEVLKHAISLGARIIHIECLPNKAKIFYHLKKIHGVSEIPEAKGKKFFQELKTMAHLDDGHTHEQGEFSKEIAGKYFHAVLTFFPLPIGEKVNIEIEESEDDRFKLTYLGMSHEDSALVEKEISKNDSGIFIVTGPNGSGRTSTMYSLLRIFAKKNRKIGTVENPIECYFDGIYQKEVRPEAGITFIAGLRDVLQNGAEVVMIESARDFETIKMIFHEAQKGKAIIVSLHELTLSGAIEHFEKMGIPREDVANNVKLVINQRLVLRLCKNCKKEIPLEENELAEIERNFHNLPKKVNHSNIKIGKFVHSHCMLCNETGFLGHVGLFEILVSSEALKKAVLKGEMTAKEKDLLLEQGTFSFYQDGLKKAQEGITTIEEVLRVK